VPLGIVPQEYIVRSQKSFGANRILSETKVQKKETDIDNELKNHGQKPKKPKHKAMPLDPNPHKAVRSVKTLRELITAYWTLSFEPEDGDAKTEFVDKEPDFITEKTKNKRLQATQPANTSNNEQAPAATDAQKDDATIKPIDLKQYSNNGFATEVKASYLVACLSMVMATLFVLM